MALTAGLGLSVHSLNVSQSSRSQIIAANLAREGIDVVRMMRDSNWLAAAAGSTCGGGSAPPCACPDLSNQPCYPAAFSGPTYDLNLSTTGSSTNQWRAVFNPSNRTWDLDTAQGAQRSYSLCVQSTGAYQHNSPGGGGVNCNGDFFARRIIISVRTGPTFGYSQTDLDNSEVIVQSVVQWRGKNCPALTSATVPNTTPANCKIIAEERLTNWKDYR
jgi:hypothetical protein